MRQTFKEDGFKAEKEEEILSEVRIFLSSYARSLHWEVIDIPGKLFRTASPALLKVTEATARRLDIEGLFKRVGDPPRFG